MGGSSCTSNGGMTGGKCHLVKLPSELLIAVLDRLAARDLARVAVTCSSLREIARSDEVWRSRVEDTVLLHARSKLATPWKALDGVYERYVQSLLGGTSQYLGAFASKQSGDELK